MHEIKRLIFREVRAHHGGNTAKLSDDELNFLMFHSHDSLRLTLNGFVQVKAIFTAYSFQIPPDLKSKHRIALSKMEYPYFFTTKRLILFSEMDAMVIKLHGGISQFLETYCY